MSPIIPADYSFSPLLNRIVDARARPSGSSACASTATLNAALAVLYALKLGCTVEAAVVGRISCEAETHWLVTVRPHYGRCDLLACLYTWGVCHALDDLTPDLHGLPDMGADKVVNTLASEWSCMHADFVSAVAERLGARSDWTVEALLDGLDLPQVYNFERDFGKDTQRTAWERP